MSNQDSYAHSPRTLVFDKPKFMRGLKDPTLL